MPPLSFFYSKSQKNQKFKQYPTESLTCRIPTALVRREGKSARTETRQRRRCCNNTRAHFSAPGLPWLLKGSCLHQDDYFESIGQGWCNQLPACAPWRGKEGGRTGAKETKVSPEEQSQHAHAGTTIRSPMQDEHHFQCWHRKSVCFLSKSPDPVIKQQWMPISRPSCQHIITPNKSFKRRAVVGILPLPQAPFTATCGPGWESKMLPPPAPISRSQAGETSQVCVSSKQRWLGAAHHRQAQSNPSKAWEHLSNLNKMLNTAVISPETENTSKINNSAAFCCVYTLVCILGWDHIHRIMYKASGKKTAAAELTVKRGGECLWEGKE